MKSVLDKILNKLSIFNSLPIWVLMALFAISVGVSVYALRENNQKMVVLRAAVYEADEKNGDVEGALENLRRFVHSHMNTNLSSGPGAIKPPIQLKYTYERLQAAEQAKAEAVNSQIYTEAQAYCEQQNPGGVSGRTRVPCIQEYVTSHGGEKPNSVPVSLYQYDFVSPSWSPDLAGWSLAVSGLLFLSLAGSLIADRLFKSKLKPL